MENLELKYKTKYLKYKLKYNQLKSQLGGSSEYAKSLSEYVNSENIFEVNHLKLVNNLNPEIMLDRYINGFNFDANKKQGAKYVIDQILFKMSESFKLNKYLHIFFVRDLNNLYSKVYQEDSSCMEGHQRKNIKFFNFPESGLLTIKDDLIINKFPILPTNQTYNYGLMFVTDLNTNETYYYMVLVKFPNKFEYIAKHSNIRLYLPDEWKDREDIDMGLVASGEIKFDAGRRIIEFDFNSSSMIVEMFTRSTFIIDNFKLKYLSTIDDVYRTMLHFGTTPDLNRTDKQLFSLIYFFVNYCIIYKILTKLKNDNPSAAGYGIEIHPSYHYPAGLGNSSYTVGFYSDHVNTLGGVHDYNNRNCQSNSEVQCLNMKTMNNYQVKDFSDSNKAINCINIQDVPLLYPNLDPAKSLAFEKYCKKLL